MRNLSDHEVAENNKKIAAFMGGEYKMSIFKDMLWMFPLESPVYKLYHGTDAKVPRFDKSVEALIIVLQSIERRGCIVELWMSMGYGCRIHQINPKGISGVNYTSESNDLAEAMFETIIQYVDAFNALKGV